MNKNVILSSFFFLATVALAGFGSVASASPTFSQSQRSVEFVENNNSVTSVSATFKLSASSTKVVSKVDVKAKTKVCSDYKMWSDGGENVRICEYK